MCFLAHRIQFEFLCVLGEDKDQVKEGLAPHLEGFFEVEILGPRRCRSPDPFGKTWFAPSGFCRGAVRLLKRRVCVHEVIKTRPVLHCLSQLLKALRDRRAVWRGAFWYCRIPSLISDDAQRTIPLGRGCTKDSGPTSHQRTDSAPLHGGDRPPFDSTLQSANGNLVLGSREGAAAGKTFSEPVLGLEAWLRM